MNKRFLALACVLAMLLAGCSSMLNREYSSSAAHVEYPVSEGASVLQAENYQGLVNAILYFVTEHEETGLIHLTSYTGDVGTAFSTACREVLTEDPLGAYAVEEITYDYTRTPDHYEATVSISYAHTAEEVAAIAPATGSTAIRQTISAAMTAFSAQCVLRVSYFTGDESSLKQLVRQTYLDTPLAALAPLDVSVTLYPNSGTSRIVELTFDWPLPTEELSAQRADLEQQALALLERLDALLEDQGRPSEPPLPEDLLAVLRPAALYSHRGGNTAYAALVDHSANDQGVALALRLLCQLVDLDSMVVEGTLDGQPRFWLIVSTAEGYRHLDPTARELSYATDDELRELGYVWHEDAYPDCTDYTAALQTDPENGAEEDPEAPGVANNGEEGESGGEDDDENEEENAGLV